jgi:ribosomal protein S18 acetylase RimI-like enzyme
MLPDVDDIEIAVGSPAGQDRAELVDSLLAYNREATGITQDEELSAFIRDEAGDLIAGVYGWVFGGAAEVALIWVRDDHRGRGLGSRLLNAFEAKAESMGSRQMVMRTHSFQAPDFYRAHGYGDVAAIDDYPAGHRYHLLRKPLGAK